MYLSAGFVWTSKWVNSKVSNRASAIKAQRQGSENTGAFTLFEPMRPGGACHSKHRRLNILRVLQISYINRTYATNMYVCLNRLCRYTHHLDIHIPSDDNAILHFFPETFGRDRRLAQNVFAVAIAIRKHQDLEQSRQPIRPMQRNPVNDLCSCIQLKVILSFVLFTLETSGQKHEPT